FAVPFLNTQDEKLLSGRKVLVICDTLPDTSALSNILAKGINTEHILAFAGCSSMKEEKILQEKNISFSFLAEV
ncbi:MAG: hypothetical protein IKC08_01820, partial [Lentisphaeria bacterium]|nr:hypothetical protein [Lentisphaeria bacterium]